MGEPNINVVDKTEIQTSDYTLTVLCPKDLNQFVTICDSFQGL